MIGDSLPATDPKFRGDVIGHPKLEEAIAETWKYLLEDPQRSDVCAAQHCHRQIFVSEETLNRHKIDYVKYRQVPGHIVVTGTRSIHQVVNTGVLMNQAINLCPRALIGEFRWRTLAKVMEPGICYECLRSRCVTLTMLQQLNSTEIVPRACNVAAHLVRLHPTFIPQNETK